MQNRVGRNLFLISILAPMLTSAVALAGGSESEDSAPLKMDVATHNMVIKKLESALPGLKGQAGEMALRVRLADLYSDRARLKTIDEEATSCKTCDGAKLDRTTAIDYYMSALSHTSGQQKEHALMQVTHLYSLQGDTKKAEGLFKATLAAPSTKGSLRGESFAGLGELYFRGGNYPEARKNYEQALNFEISNPTLAQYRLSWCQFNNGNARKAKSIVLAALRTLRANSAAADSSFQKDMARDLATFIARDGIDNSSIEQLISLSPESERRSNLFYLGQEADRLGNKAGALLVWQRYTALGTVAGDESLEIQIRTAQTIWDQNLYRQSLDLYKKFYIGLAQADCKKQENCDDLRARSRAYAHTWIKKEKKNPSEGLYEALQIYAQYNSGDVEMVQWAGHIARRRQHREAAAKFYAQSADESARQLNSHDITDAKRIFLAKTLEGSLLAEIECAEESTDKAIMTSAYAHYLSLRPDGEKQFQVRYQIAHLKYDQKRFAEAAAEFDRIANESKCRDLSLRLQAADLALDSWANIGDTAHVESQSKIYASNFPQKKNNYLAVARKATVNASIQRYSKNISNNSEVAAALSQLGAAPLAGATEQERASIYKNQILMAQKISDINTVLTAAQNMLSIKKLSPTDKDFANGAQLWAFEARLDFSNAFRVAKQIHFSDLSIDARYLKFALLAELSGHDARIYYQNFLRSTHNQAQAAGVYAKMIHEAKNPWQMLGTFRAQLKKSPEIYGASVIEAFAKSRRIDELKKYSNDRSIARSSSYPTIQRYLALDSDQKLDKMLSQTHLNTRSDSGIQRTLKIKIALLKTAEKRANFAMARNDFTLQIIALNRVAEQYSRLYNDLLALPLPRNLKKSQRRAYAQLLHERAAPFKATAETAKQKLASLWAQSGAVAKLMELSQTEFGGARQLLISDLNLLSRFAPRGQASEIERALEQARKTPSRDEANRARLAVRSQPFDTEKIETLKKIEARRDEVPMVVFLEARLENLNDKLSTQKKVAR